MRWKFFRSTVAIILSYSLFLGINVTKVSAKTDLVVEGNVLGYHQYKIRPFGTFALLLDPVLVKITKLVEGKESSEYIKVLQLFDENYAKKNFGLDKISTFKLERYTFCDEKIKSLITERRTMKIGENVETTETFNLVSGVEKVSLPLKKKIPCYVISRETIFRVPNL